MGKFTYLRCYADEAGESHFEDVELDLPLGQFGIETVGMSQSFDAKSAFFMEVKASSDEAEREVDWHTAPSRRFIVYISGEAEQEASDGEVRRLGPGDVALFEDTTGKGHKSRNITDRMLMMIPLAD